MTAAPRAETYRAEVAIGADLAALHEELDRMRVIPGWHRPGRPPMWSSPRPELRPMHRSYARAHEALTQAGALVSPSLAERRNLILANVESGSQYATTRTQILAYQMMRPGERARTHRHAPHAGRLVIDADGGVFTVVDGTRIFMEPGDVLLTPGWSWHGHGHEGATSAYWLDFLDVPLVQLLEPMFFEPYPEGWEEPVRTDRDSSLLFPWRDTKRRLAKVEPSGPLGGQIELPTPSMPTVGLRMHRLSSSWTPVFRSTANYQFCVVEGSGTSRVGDVEMHWERGDVVVVPCWHEQRHRAEAEAVLFSVSDTPVQQFCGYLKEEVTGK